MSGSGHVSVRNLFPWVIYLSSDRSGVDAVLCCLIFMVWFG